MGGVVRHVPPSILYAPLVIPNVAPKNRMETAKSGILADVWRL